MISRSNTASISSPTKSAVELQKGVTSITESPVVDGSLKPPQKSSLGRAVEENNVHRSPNAESSGNLGVGRALSDTPLPTAPNSPSM